MARLRVTRDGRDVGTVEIGTRDLRLGRAPENDLVLEDSGTAVSRYHAELRVVGDSHVLVNLSQPFGLWANGHRAERVVMAAGVSAMIGPFHIAVETAAEQAAVAAPPVASAVADSNRPVPTATIVAAAAASAGLPTTAATDGATTGPEGRPTVVPPTVALPPPLSAPSPALTDAALAASPANVLPMPVTNPAETIRPTVVANEAGVPVQAAGRSSLTNWVVFGAVAAGLVAVVGLAQLISPSTITRPAPVEAAAGGGGTAPSDDALRARLNAARDAIERGQNDQALRDLQGLLAASPDHAEALALKARAESASSSSASTPASTREAGVPSATVAGAATGAPADGARAAADTNASAAGRSTSTDKTAVDAQPSTPGARPVARGAASIANAASNANTKPLLQRPGTRDPAFAGRNADVVRRFEQAESAFKAGQYRLAISNLQSVLRSDSTFPTAEAKLEEVKSTVRTMAEAAFAEGVKLEKSGEFSDAIRAYERSQEIATMMYAAMNGADEAIARVRESMVSTGQDAFKRARQYDALGRGAEAVSMYSRALELLPPADPNRQVAQERLSVLKR